MDTGASSSLVPMEEHREDSIEEPRNGMLFDSFNDAFEFYKRYADYEGFVLKIRSTIARRVNGNDQWVRRITCSREGTRKSSATVRNARSLANCDCKAKVCVKRLGTTGLYEYCYVHLPHNHDLLPPDQLRYYPQNRFISMQHRSVIEQTDCAGVRPSKIFQVIVQGAGSHDKVNFLKSDMYNYIHRDVRCVTEEYDGQELMNYFQRMREQNQNFYYEVMLDENRRIYNVFWCDARSRAAFKDFGQVVSFDTTYQTNTYGMPFASFIGVNHHRKSILLGCALLSVEDTETFCWLFRSFKTCMGESPEAIITDQAQAMKNAIEIEFPGARHRWCIWHITKKIPDKFSSREYYQEIKKSILQAIWNSLSMEEFDNRWIGLMQEFNLQDNDWLKGLYVERRMWAPAYVNRGFWAGMNSTQRSEQMHAYYGNFIYARYKLVDFVKAYDNILADKANKEEEIEFRNKKGEISCLSSLAYEKEFQKYYTHDMFMQVRDELTKSLNCASELVEELGDCVIFKVIENKVIDDDEIGSLFFDQSYRVHYQTNSNMFNCECLLFDYFGIVCRHSFRVLQDLRVKDIPKSYFLERWSRVTEHPYLNIRSSYDERKVDVCRQRYDDIIMDANNLAERACVSELSTRNVRQILRSLASEPVIPDDVELDESQTNSSIATVKSPAHLKKRGRPRSCRLRSVVDKKREQAQRRSRLSGGSQIEFRR